MSRKKWTPRLEITDSLIKFREKRKWQLALRRYVVEKKSSPLYARYFGLDICTFRKWIEIQFDGDKGWENFGTAWQFDHVVPVAYFDFSSEGDLLLCWNFINMRAVRTEAEKIRGNRSNLLSAKLYFEALYKDTGYMKCLKMLQKIDTIENIESRINPAVADFIVINKDLIEQSSLLNGEEFNELNKGRDIKEVLAERELINKFG